MPHISTISPARHAALNVAGARKSVETAIVFVHCTCETRRLTVLGSVMPDSDHDPELAAVQECLEAGIQGVVGSCGRPNRIQRRKVAWWWRETLGCPHT